MKRTLWLAAIIVTALVLISAFPVMADICITGNTTWSGTVNLDTAHDYYVCDGGVLTIANGATVNVGTGKSIIVGEAGSCCSFDTGQANIGSATITKAVDTWGALQFKSGDTGYSTVEGATIRYGGYNSPYNALVYVEDANIGQFEYSSIIYSYGDGLVLKGSSAYIDVHDSNIGYNNGNGVYMLQDAEAYLHGNEMTIHDNSRGIHNYSGAYLEVAGANGNPTRIYDNANEGVYLRDGDADMDLVFIYNQNCPVGTTPQDVGIRTRGSAGDITLSRVTSACHTFNGMRVQAGNVEVTDSQFVANAAQGIALQGGDLTLMGDEEDSHNYIYYNGAAGLKMTDGYLFGAYSLFYNNSQTTLLYDGDGDSYTAGIFILGGDTATSYLVGSCVMGNRLELYSTADHAMEAVNASEDPDQIELYGYVDYWGAGMLNPEVFSIWDEDDNGDFGDIETVSSWTSCPYDTVDIFEE